jgi:hypothetical protein
MGGGEEESRIWGSRFDTDSEDNHAGDDLCFSYMLDQDQHSA